jgi:hypothetical protein
LTKHVEQSPKKIITVLGKIHQDGNYDESNKNDDKINVDSYGNSPLKAVNSGNVSKRSL